MTGQEAIEYIHSMVWNRRATGYEHAKALLKKMGNPEKALKYVHVGGTNGKGSTATMLASVLQQAGYRTGLYTSPYLYRFNERIRIDGKEISDEDLADTTEYVKSIVETMPECPSEFAVVCCVAFEYFYRQKCDIVVLEVGMGGVNDSTNVIDCPEVAVMTNIGLDHTEYLGNTLEAIAETKSGIFKENGRAVVYRNTTAVETVFQNVCKERNVKLTFAEFASLQLRECSLEGQRFDYGKRENLFIPLLGEHQLKNTAVALTAIDILKQRGWDITEEHIRQGLENVRWPGRFEVISKEPLFIIDGGHNPQCIEALAQNVKDYLSGHYVIAITGVMSDKDYREMYQPIIPYISEFICITPSSPRSLDAVELAGRLKEMGAIAKACDSVKEAVKDALERTGSDDAIICFGTLYSIAEIQATFEIEHLH